MYKIVRKGKRIPTVLKNTFQSYDEARSAVRKWLRSQMEKGKLVRDAIDLSNRTVSIGFYGFSVSKCA